MAKKGQKFRKYSVEEKEKILKEYHDGYSSRYLGRKYGISYSTIDMWIHNIRYFKVGGKKGRPKTKNPTLEDYKERYEILKKYQAFLQARREKK